MFKPLVIRKNKEQKIRKKNRKNKEQSLQLQYQKLRKLTYKQQYLDKEREISASVLQAVLLSAQTPFVIAKSLHVQEGLNLEPRTSRVRPGPLDSCDQSHPLIIAVNCTAFASSTTVKHQAPKSSLTSHVLSLEIALT